MKFFPAKAQRLEDMLGSFAPRRLGGKKLIAITIALSFLAMLAPIAGASNSSNTMPCCAGKSGHCDSGLGAKKLPQPKEPMCGLHTELEADGITIVAEPQSEPHHSFSRTAGTASSQAVAGSASLSQPCRMDCGACMASSTRQQKRERGIVLSTTAPDPSSITLQNSENSSLLFSSNEAWRQTSPRGPPTDLR